MRRLTSSTTLRSVGVWAVTAALAAGGLWACSDEVSDSCTGPDCEVAAGGSSGTSSTAGAGGEEPTGPSGLVSEFSLTDVNSTSPTTGEPVSPRDYLEQVSAWYFAHAT